MTTELKLPPLPKHLVAIDQNDDEFWGELQDHAWDSDYGRDLKLNAPLFTAGQMEAYARAAIEANKRAESEPSKSEPVAWLYTCKRPGKMTVYASVDANDTNHWPLDDWKSVEKIPLYAHPAPPSAQTGAQTVAQEREANYQAMADAVNSIDGWSGFTADDCKQLLSAMLAASQQEGG